MPYIESHGLGYYYESHGSGPTLVLLHGFTGSTESWAEFIQPFSQRFRAVLLDLPGHGRTASPSEPERYKMELVSRDLFTIFATLQLSDINLLGYSMGGRLAIYMACQHPNALKRLIIESSSPGLASRSQRQLRVEADNRLANKIEQDGIPAFVERWQKLPLFVSQQQLSLERRQQLHKQRLKNSALGLANSLRGMGTGRQPSLWTKLGSIQLPVFILAGQKDTKFASIAERMATELPRAMLQIVPGAGHNIHLEKPHLFACSVSDFISQSREAAPN